MQPTHPQPVRPRQAFQHGTALSRPKRGTAPFADLAHSWAGHRVWPGGKGATTPTSCQQHRAGTLQGSRKISTYFSPCTRPAEAEAAGGTRKNGAKRPAAASPPGTQGRHHRQRPPKTATQSARLAEAGGRHADARTGQECTSMPMGTPQNGGDTEAGGPLPHRRHSQRTRPDSKRHRRRPTAPRASPSSPSTCEAWAAGSQNACATCWRPCGALPPTGSC